MTRRSSSTPSEAPEAPEELESVNRAHPPAVFSEAAEEEAEARELELSEMQLQLVEAKIRWAELEFEKEEYRGTLPPPPFSPLIPACLHVHLSSVQAARASSAASSTSSAAASCRCSQSHLTPSPTPSVPRSPHTRPPVSSHLHAPPHQVAQHSTQLEVQLAQSRSEAARLRKDNEALQTDMSGLIELKLQLAEANAKLANE